MYTDKVIAHFKHPHNQGVLKNADAVGEEGNPNCGDIMKMYLKIDGDVISEIKFETLGCAAAIAVSSSLTDLVKGKTIAEALEVTKDDVVDDLGGLPAVKIHCSMLGVDALKTALHNYLSGKVEKKDEPVKKLSQLEEKIVAALDEIRPSLQADGGDLEFVSFDEATGILHIALTGACLGCPMSGITLKEGIEAEVMAAVNEVKEVKAV